MSLLEYEYNQPPVETFMPGPAEPEKPATVNSEAPSSSFDPQPGPDQGLDKVEPTA